MTYNINIYDFNSFGLNIIFDNYDDLNEGFLELSLDKKDVSIDFFEYHNDNNENDNEINLDEIFYLKKVVTKHEKCINTFTGNGNIGKTDITSNNRLSITKSTKEENQTKIKKTPTNSNTIFQIVKVNKKLGRIGKSRQYISGKHNKWSPDNIIQKIKANFHEKLFNYINKEYEKYLIINHIDRPQLIKRISSVESKNIKKDDNLLWFSLKLKDLFSIEISSKYTRFSENYNKNNIEKLYKENKAKDVINILEKTVREVFNEFCNDMPIDGFETIKYDLESQKKKMEKENEDNIEYLKKYKDIAQNLEQIYKLKKSRRKNKNKNKK